MAHIFLDESGQFTKHNNEKYFVVASFIVGNPRRTEKKFRSWQRTKFPRKLRCQPEIKFSEIKIEDNLRLKTLKFIANLDVRIHYVYLLKKNIPMNYYRKEKLQSGHLYTNIIGEELEMYLPANDLEFRVFCDKRHLKGIKRSEFKEILKARLLPQMSSKSIVQIEIIDSEQNMNIQISDWIVGALARYLEGKELGNECYQILRNNLLGSGKELFKDIWDDKCLKQKSQPNG
ncbi:DUF3800 domain-containing protein [Candidatus Parcubacteria bacterium]|nr:DUF3800 domain-containing protein [Candidatus Parcubacteria bacterium]